MSSTRKQQIRPRFVDLAEFDDDQYAQPSSADPDGSSAFNWPSAATVVRKPPPAIASSSNRSVKKSAPTASTATTSQQRPDLLAQPHPTEPAPPQTQPAKARSVRIALESHNQVKHIEPSSSAQLGVSTSGFSFGPSSQPSRRPPAHQHQHRHEAQQVMPGNFTLDFDQGGQGSAAAAAEGSAWGLSGPVEVVVPLIGSISERKPACSSSGPAGPSRSQTGDRGGIAKPKARSGSRFLASRQMDADMRSASESKAAALARVKTWDDQESGTGFPRVPRRDVVEPILPRLGSKSSDLDYSEDLRSAPAPSVDRGAQAQAAASADDGEEWLDESGRPMSVFRKSRLLKQGLRPPAVRRKDEIPSLAPTQQSALAANDVDDDDAPDYVRDPTRDPGGGADPESVTALLASVSTENDRKVKAMDAAEVEEELRSLEAFFGKNVLDALRSRKPAAGIETGGDAPSSKVEKPAEKQAQVPAAEDAPEPTAAVDLDRPDSIRRRYFPGEPEGRNASLEWMMPQDPRGGRESDAKEAQGEAVEPRFDFKGRLLEKHSDTDRTYVAGLHHHGDDQEAPGYTTSELLHLARSSVAAQRQLALNVLGRICTQYPLCQPQRSSGNESQAHEQKRSSSSLLPDTERATIQARSMVTARFLLQDRHFTVRSAALRCLAAVLRSGPSGEQPTPGATLLVDWKQLGLAAAPAQTKDKDDMAFEDIVKADWVDFLVGSGFLDLCVEQTSTLVASTWDAEMLLEVLWRMASCSADRARRVAGADEKPMRDLIVDLGLKTTWPPSGSAGIGGSGGRATMASESGSTSWPSLSAARLLHLGILADRESAKAMVLDGTVDHLLRFVMLYPWKLEDDLLPQDTTPQGTAKQEQGAGENEERGESEELVLRAYDLFSTCLDIYNSLGLYGQYASVAGRTWSVWQDVGAWANHSLQSLQATVTSETVAPSTSLRRAKASAAERFFRLLETWTVCAKDPHQLLGHHDITWTQVRDWIEASCDALSGLAAAAATDLEKEGEAEMAAARIAGAAVGHLVAWMDCCKGKQADLVQDKRGAIESALHGAAAAILPALGRIDLDDGMAPAAERLEELAALCTAASNLRRLQQGLEDIEAESHGRTAPHYAAVTSLATRLLASASLWMHLSSPTSRAQGSYSHRSAIVRLVAQTLSDAEADDDDKQLALIGVLGGADRALLRRVTDAAMQRHVGAAGAAVLSPFVDEYVCGGHEEARRQQVLARSRASLDVHPCSGRLADRVSLFYTEVENPVEPIKRDQSKTEETEGRPDDTDTAEVDALTHTPFWRSPSIRLPLRADWPLVALDELLHSANSAVLNRRDNLDDAYEANEQTIVETSLRLGVSVFSSILDSFKGEVDEKKKTTLQRIMPTSTQIHVAVCKVFMLEHGQVEMMRSDSSRSGKTVQSGILTGRELFRDDAISRNISKLLDLADELDTPSSRAGRCYNRWTTTTLGEATSFYTLFTDLLGLYDSISFGDENFARLILTLTSTRAGLDVEYRRLLWNDYALSLPSMRIQRNDASYRGERDTDADMLKRYEGEMKRLKSRGLTAFVPYRVARWHVLGEQHEGSA